MLTGVSLLVLTINPLENVPPRVDGDRSRILTVLHHNILPRVDGRVEVLGARGGLGVT